jgi:general L-amino acid transport system substrate-binding protein
MIPMQPRRTIHWLIFSLMITAACLAAIKTNGQSIVSRIRQDNRVTSAVNVRAGWADLPTGKAWEGLAIDLTKALAAAILSDKDKVGFEVGDRKSGPAKVQHGEVNLYLPVEPMSPSKLAAAGLATSQPFFFNVQRIMVRKDSGLNTVDELVKKPIAVQPGYVNEQNFETANEQRLRDYFERSGRTVMEFPFQEWDEMESAFVSGHVIAVSAEETELGRLRAANHEEVGDAVMLPEVIATEPVSAVLRPDDPNWERLVNTAISVLIRAEELGITSETIDTDKKSKDPEVLYLLGVRPGIGSFVGLDDQWAERVIRAVGNYSQAFKRNLGSDSPLNIERSLNATWRHGGLLCTGPIW